MPRGVVIPELRQHLFAAVERVIAADGPSRLTGRAVTREAGVATGLLHAHFATFDDFLTGYAVDRTFLIAGAVSGLPERAGSGTVAGNLGAALLAPPPGMLLALTRLLAVRPDLTAGVEAVLGEEAAGLRSVRRAVDAYLTAEQRLGRVPAEADPAALALAITGTLHHVALTGDDAVSWIPRVVTALTSGLPAI